MSGTRRGARPAAAPVEEDPNAAVVCSSPPCFMHELDPSYLGYLGREEVATLLDALLAAGWGAAAPDEEARLRAALRRHLEALGGLPGRPRGASGGPTSADEALGRRPDGLASMVRKALPRIHEDAIRRDLGEVLGSLEQGAPR